MAINPTLLMMLMQYAPALLATLQNKAQGSTGDITIPNGIASALDRGYDPGLIQDTLTSGSVKNLTDPLGTTNKLYENALGNSDKLFDTKGFPSDNTSGLDLINIAEGNVAGTNPAEILTGKMIRNGIPSEADIPPYPGGLSEVDHLSNEIDSLPNSPYRTSLIQKMNLKAKPTTLQDLYGTLLNQKSYNSK